MLRPLTCPITVGLSGKDNEFDLVVASGGPLEGGQGEAIVLIAVPDPLREDPGMIPVPAKLMFEQNDIFDFLLELCLSNVFCAEKGDGLTI